MPPLPHVSPKLEALKKSAAGEFGGPGPGAYSPQLSLVKPNYGSATITERKIYEDYSDSSHGPTLSPGPAAHQVSRTLELRSPRNPKLGAFGSMAEEVAAQQVAADGPRRGRRLHPSLASLPLGRGPGRSPAGALGAAVAAARRP